MIQISHESLKVSSQMPGESLTLPESKSMGVRRTMLRQV